VLTCRGARSNATTSKAPAPKAARPRCCFIQSHHRSRLAWPESFADRSWIGVMTFLPLTFATVRLLASHDPAFTRWHQQHASSSPAPVTLRGRPRRLAFLVGAPGGRELHAPKPPKRRNRGQRCSNWDQTQQADHFQQSCAHSAPPDPSSRHRKFPTKPQRFESGLWPKDC
jgi:hypothetical protein